MALDEGNHVADVGVDTGLAGFSAAKAPGDETHESGGVLVGDGAAAVALAGVLAALVKGSAELVGGNDIWLVVVFALGVVHNGDIDLAELNGEGEVAFLGSAPDYC